MMANDYCILHHAIAPALAHAVLRTLYLDLFTQGLSAREVAWWTDMACWFPHLRNHATVQALRAAIPSASQRGQPCEPQLLLVPPETYNGELWPHVDEPPAWAQGRSYSAILGVPLTPFTEQNGGIRLMTQDGERVPELLVGDVLVMAPTLPHTRGINRSSEVRAAVYFRYLQEEE